MTPLLTTVLRLPLPKKTERKEYSIEFGNRRISYVLSRTERKNIRVMINPDLNIEVYAPQMA